MKIVIIGNGPAAVAAAETARSQDAGCDIVMISRETVPFYSPCPLAEYVEGSVAREILFLRDWDFYARQRITLRLGKAVTGIDTAGRRVLMGEEAEPYDRLLIASGSKAFVPPVPGLSTARGVFELKTLADAEAILERIAVAERAVVIGSGFIGLEAVQALVHKGLHVTLLEARDHVLPAMLDREMATLVRQRLEEHGVDVRTNCAAEQVLEDADGVCAVRAGGQDFPCRLVIAAAGVRADLSILDGSGIATNRGILVDAFMRTNLPEVFAAGDVIERADAPEKYQVLPNWPNAVSTGRIAGYNLAGGNRRHPGLEAINIVRIFGVPVTSFGAQSGEHQVRWDGDGAVRKLLISGGRLVGGQFVGDIDGSGVLHEMMKNAVPVERFGTGLARPGFGYIHVLEG